MGRDHVTHAVVGQAEGIHNIAEFAIVDVCENQPAHTAGTFSCAAQIGAPNITPPNISLWIELRDNVPTIIKKPSFLGELVSLAGFLVEEQAAYHCISLDGDDFDSHVASNRPPEILAIREIADLACIE